MSKLNDSLNYSQKWDNVDSDDEDYFTKKMIQSAVSKKSTANTIRSDAKELLARKDKLNKDVNGEYDNDDVSSTMLKAQLSMEAQLKDLRMQSNLLKKKEIELSGIKSEDETKQFMNREGVSESDLMNFINEHQGGGGGVEVVDSDDENEDNKTESNTKENVNLNENKPMAKPTSSAPLPNTPKKKPTKSVKTKPTHELTASEGFFSCVVKLPGVSAMNQIDLNVSETTLIVACSEIGTISYHLDVKVDRTIDGESLSAKFNKKKGVLTVKGLFL